MSEAGAATDTVTAGTLLREAREAAGLHLATLAANLKVPARKLEALEEDRYDLLPDAVFVRALASSVCRTLKVDPQPVLQRLPQTAQPRLVQDREGINAPFRAPGDGPNPGVLDQLQRPVVLAVIALLLGAVVLIFLPIAREEGGTASPSASTDPVMPPAGAAAPAEPQVTNSLSAPAPASPAALPASASAAAPATAASLAPAPGAARTSVTAAAQGPAAPASAAAVVTGPAAGVPVADGIIVFRTRGDSWVHVTDAGGATVLRKLMTAGDSAAATGKLPLSVTVGDAKQTEVQVRGKPYDLAPLARDNVARFEVK
ncbi:RodZ domain-containing protein [Ramlibacter sp. PS3R-8]|uniref:helix-turn-helix domain-containing protein n=1 Tax=Ramlibacter sp. PS3R-8 TaxID=3133437 RepID=UPI0030B2D013